MRQTPDISRSQLNALIDEWVFNERDRAILKRRMLDGVIYEALADEFGLSVQHTKNIVYKAQDKIFRHI